MNPACRSASTNAKCDTQTSVWPWQNLLFSLIAICCVGMQISAAAYAADRAGQAAKSAPRYVQIQRSVDGIGKQYMGREIAAVMGWQGADWLERPERAKEEGSELLLKRLQLRPGLRVADVGAGTGYYARRIARAVAPTGLVYAVDVQPQMIELLTARAKEADITNLVPVLASTKSTQLAPASIDLALMVDVYHELEFPFEVLHSIVRALKPGGRVIFVEYRAEDASVPIKPVHKMSEAQVRKEAAAHALKFVKTDASLPWQHLIIFEKR
jgi:SAM-dependent methyltransferase